MFDNYIPMFVGKALCADKAYDPDLWHPQELAGRHRKWSYTPDATLARSICSVCPAKIECRSYALQYFNLSGIWGGMDRLERHAMQEALGMTPLNWTDTYNSSLSSVPPERTNNG
jgi:hypothetical protein